jgi:adenosylmethionine-8-amino-7-oxononanoate aminotransferase
VVLQLSPPFVVTERELAQVVDGISAALQDVVPASSRCGI